MSFRTFSISRLKRFTTISLVIFAMTCAIVFASNASDVQQRRTAEIETELITVTRRGFEPAEITRPEGKFILMIDNPGREDLNLQLSREAGEKLHEIKASQAEPNWNEIQDLRPGRYVLAEQNHPEWKSVITITAR